MAAHARHLQASSAHRWMHCTAAPRMEHGIADDSSKYGEQGTAAHELAATVLRDGKDCAAYVGRTFNGFVVTENEDDDESISAANVQIYVDYVRRVVGQYPNATLLVEQRVDFRRYLGLSSADVDEGFGTADAIIIAPQESTIHVIDLKYGIGERVDVEHNDQLLLYGLGALSRYSLLHDFDNIEMHIVQPRIDHFDSWTQTREEIEAYAESARHKAREVLALVEKRLDHSEVVAALAPATKTCRWCRAKSICPALRDEVLGSVFGCHDFSDLDIVETLTENDTRTVDVAETLPRMRMLDVYMGKLDLVEQWMAAIRAEVERMLLDGVQFDHWKLVEGRQGARKWRSENDAIKVMKKLRLKKAEIFLETVISPTTAEKRFAKSNPRVWELLQSIITRADGKPSVAHISDKRPAWRPIKENDLGALDLIE